jgi:Lipase (class 3)
MEDSTAMNLIDALKCSVLCQMAYDGDADTVAAFLKAPAHGKAVGDVFCIVCDMDPQFVIFRGTASIGGWLLDLDAAPMYSARFLNGKVHQGFNEAFNEIASWLYERLRTDRPIQITGHSLGAAIATLASQWLANAKAGHVILPVYTFGSPRVGDGAFAAAYAPTQYRVVNDLDPIPHVPIGFGYTHVGAEVRLPECKPAGIFRPVADLLIHLRNGLGPTAIEAIKDHFADNYRATIESLQTTVSI